MSETRYSVQTTQGHGNYVHPCRRGWAPARNPWHRKRGSCPSYGERPGKWFVAFWWQARPVSNGDRSYLSRIEKELWKVGATTVLPLEE